MTVSQLILDILIMVSCTAEKRLMIDMKPVQTLYNKTKISNAAYVW